MMFNDGLKHRFLIFSRKMLQLCRTLPKQYECETIRKQLAGSATSIGANYEEADGTVTKKDFLNKIVISRKEAKETIYWLKIVSGIYFPEKQIEPHIRECSEFIRMLSSIINKVQAKL
ncbi:MAG: four helix bundle protein [Candidatus Margulisiibacteriota bacterium]